MSVVNSFLNRQQFVEHVLAVVRKQFPLAKVARGPQSFSIHFNGQTASLENLYRAVKLQPETMEHQITRWAVELLRFEETAEITSTDFEELKDRLLPVLVPEAGVTEELPTHEVVSGLISAVAVDHDRVISYVSRGLFNSWNQPQMELHDLAVKNLLDRSAEMRGQTVEKDGEINVILFQSFDGYDASRILLPNLFDRLAPYLGGVFFAGVPNRDLLVCFRDEAVVVDDVLPRIQKQYRSCPHQISDKVFAVTPDGLAPR